MPEDSYNVAMPRLQAGGGGGEPGGVSVCREQGCCRAGGVLARGCGPYVDPQWPRCQQGSRGPTHVGSQ